MVTLSGGIVSDLGREKRRRSKKRRKHNTELEDDGLEEKTIS